MTDAIILASLVSVFLIFMAFNSDRLRRKDRENEEEQRGRESATAVKAVLRMSRRWQLSDDELATLLGGLPVARVQHWRDQLAASEAVDAELTPDQIYRVRYLLGIDKTLHRLFSDEAQADCWIKRPHTAPGFEGRTALEVMKRGYIEDLCFVRRYLDDVCQP